MRMMSASPAPSQPPVGPATGSGTTPAGTRVSPAWSNWDRRQTCTPAAVEHPAGLGELSDALHRAQVAGRGVRVTGSGHSFTGLVPTPGTLISLSEMNRLIDVDPASGLVRVQGGITLAALNAALDRYG